MYCLARWWLVRVTLVVDWLFLPQNFGPMVGTYEGLLWLCEWTLDGDCTSRWWGHISTICHHQSFFPQLVVGTLKPSITFVLLPLLPLTPSCSLFLPSHSPLAPLAPLSLPLLPLTPSHFPCSLLPPLTPLTPLIPCCPLPPQRWWEPQNIV